jgi:hypothetical protein
MRTECLKMAQKQSSIGKNAVLEISQGQIIAGCFGFIMTGVFSIAFISEAYYLVALLPIALSIVFLTGIFKKRKVTFDAVNKTVTVSTPSLLPKPPKVDSFHWSKVTDVVFRRETGGRGTSGHRRVYLLLDDNSEVLVKDCGSSKRAASLRSQVASFMHLR